MTYLVDADVLSEPTKLSPSLTVKEWLIRHEGELGVCSITLGEVRLGILSLPSGRRRRDLEAWFDARVEDMAIVEFDAAAALAWSVLLAGLRRKGQPMPFADSLVAATALARDLTIVTRNIHDFHNTGARVLNPFVR